MLLSQTGTLWQYLGSFVLYTLLAIGMIYAAYFYTRKHAGNLPGFIRRPGMPKQKLEIESVLALEPRKNLYVVRSGHERFLLSTSMDGTQFLSRLESAEHPETALEPAAASASSNVVPMEKPWYAQPPESASAQPGMGARLVQSMQWLIAARSGRSH